MKRMPLLLTAAMVVVALMALAVPASAATTFVADSCANLRTIQPPAEIVIEPQGTTLTTPSGEEKCAPKPTGGPNRTEGGDIETK